MGIITQPSKVPNRAVEFLKRGGIVICPTDTVYGFLADASNKKAVEKIYKTKKRSKSKPLPLFVKDLKMAKEIAEIDSKQEKILKKHWPGKYTFVLKQKKVDVGRLPLYGIGRKTIAVRIPKYKFLNNLLKKINKPLSQTSVNLSNQPPLTRISDIKKFVGGKDLLILVIDGGDIKNKKSSKIIDLTEERNEVLRK